MRYCFLIIFLGISKEFSKFYRLLTLIFFNYTNIFALLSVFKQTRNIHSASLVLHTSRDTKSISQSPEWESVITGANARNQRSWLSQERLRQRLLGWVMPDIGTETWISYNTAHVSNSMTCMQIASFQALIRAVVANQQTRLAALGSRSLDSIGSTMEP